MTPEFARAEYRPMSMVIIPPRAAVSEDTAFSSHQLIEQGGVIEDAALVACKDIHSRRFKMGDEARILAARLGVDAIIVSRIEAAGASGGAASLMP